jgi:predicted O-methyltransferase YrrM
MSTAAAIGDALPVKVVPQDAAGRALRTARKSPLYGRAAMLTRLPRLAARHDRTSRALGRALGTTALGRIPDDERGWIGRIEARRRELAAQDAAVAPGFKLESRGNAAPGRPTAGKPAPISGILALFSTPPAWGAFQMRLVRELAPETCLELGTGLGVSASYQAAALELNGVGRLVTLEGSRAWGSVAEQGLTDLGLAGRGKVRLGAIDEILPEVAAGIAPIDYAFLDADHAADATRRHFDLILPHLSPGAIVLLDDITWEARQAWKAICGGDRVSASFALGRMGVVSIS